MNCPYGWILTMSLFLCEAKMTFSAGCTTSVITLYFGPCVWHFLIGYITWCAVETFSSCVFLHSNLMWRIHITSLYETSLSCTSLVYFVSTGCTVIWIWHIGDKLIWPILEEFRTSCLTVYSWRLDVLWFLFYFIRSEIRERMGRTSYGSKPRRVLYSHLCWIVHYGNIAFLPAHCQSMDMKISST